MTIRFYCPPIWGLLLPQNLKFVTPLRVGETQDLIISLEPYQSKNSSISGALIIQILLIFFTKLKHLSKLLYIGIPCHLRALRPRIAANGKIVNDEGLVL